MPKHVRRANESGVAQASRASSVCKREKVFMIWQGNSEGCKINKATAASIAFLKANHTHTDVKKKHRATKLCCMLAEHEAKQVTGPHPETKWRDVMHKRRERERKKKEKHNMVCSLPKSNIIPASHPPSPASAQLL